MGGNFCVVAKPVSLLFWLTELQSQKCHVITLIVPNYASQKLNTLNGVSVPSFISFQVSIVGLK